MASFIKKKALDNGMRGLSLPKKRIVRLPAGLFKRFLALMVDLIIMNLVIVTPLKGKIQVPEGSFSETYSFVQNNPELMSSVYLMMGIVFVLAFFYWTVFEWKLGQTPGKMLLKILVENKMKGKITFMQSAIRNLDILSFVLFLPLWVGDIIYSQFNKEKMRLFETLSKTKSVVEVSVDG